MTPSGPFMLLDQWSLLPPPLLAPSDPLRPPLVPCKSVVVLDLLHRFHTPPIMTPSGPFQLLDLWLLHSPPPLAPSNPFRHPLATSQSVVAFRLAPLISYSTQYGSSSLFSFSVFLKKLSFEAAFIFEVVFMEIDKPQPINVFI